ncbi:hypothetical protein [Cupriavidus sp. PET2-C1]
MEDFLAADQAWLTVNAIKDPTEFGSQGAMEVTSVDGAETK